MSWTTLKFKSIIISIQSLVSAYLSPFMEYNKKKLALAIYMHLCTTPVFKRCGERLMRCQLRQLPSTRVGRQLDSQLTILFHQTTCLDIMNSTVHRTTTLPSQNINIKLRNYSCQSSQPYLTSKLQIIEFKVPF